MTIAAAIASRTADAAIDLRTIAITGAPAPGAPPGAVFWYAFDPVINNSGDVAFGGELDYDIYGDQVGPGGVTGWDNNGVWRASASGSLTMLAREFAPAPGGDRYNEFERPHLNDLGQVALQGTLMTEIIGGLRYSDPYSDESLWLAQPGGSLQLVGREGMLAPGTGGATFWSDNSFPFTMPIFQNVVLNDAGQLAFHSRAGHVSEGEGIWMTRPDGTLGPIVREGAAAPGAPPGAHFLGFGTWRDSSFTPYRVESHFDLNDQGQLAFQGTYSLSAYPPYNGTEGVWTADPHAPVLNVAMEGQAPAAGYRPIEWFQWDVKIGERGEVAYWSYPDGLALRDPAGQTRFLVSPGDPIPGTVDRTFHPWARPLRFSDSGEPLFMALEDPGIGSSEIDALLMRGDETGALDILLDEGGPISLDGVEYGFRIGSVESNANGDVIAQLSLFGVDADDSDPAARGAVVTLRGDGTWLPLVIQGEQIQVEPGVWRTVSYIGPFSDGPYSPVRDQRVLNDRGEFVLALQFADTVSGVFVGMIPEPAPGSLVVFGLIAIAVLARRRS